MLRAFKIEVFKPFEARGLTDFEALIFFNQMVGLAATEKFYSKNRPNLCK